MEDFTLKELASSAGPPQRAIRYFGNDKPVGPDAKTALAPYDKVEVDFDDGSINEITVCEMVGLAAMDAEPAPIAYTPIT